MKKPFWLKIQELVQVWETHYREAVAENNYESFANFAGIAPDLSEDTRQEQIEEILDRQTTFIKYVITSELMGRQNKEGLKWADMFVSKQYGLYDADANMNSNYLLCFSMDDHKNVQIACDSLKDIDFADIYAVTEFDMIMITRFEGKSWTETLVKSLQRTIRDDLSYDYKRVSLVRSKSRTKAGTNWLWFHFRTKDEHIRIDTIAKVRKCMEKFDVNPLDWMDRLFKPK